MTTATGECQAPQTREYVFPLEVFDDADIFGEWAEEEDQRHEDPVAVTRDENNYFVVRHRQSQVEK